MRRDGIVWLILLALLSSCGGGPSPAAPTAALTTAPALATASATAAATTSPSPAPSVAVIEMGDNFFDPAAITVKVGTTVTWKVVGQSTHDLAARDGSFANRTMTFGQTFSFTFGKAGRYPYICMQHEGDGMVGVITVVD